VLGISASGKHIKDNVGTWGLNARNKEVIEEWNVHDRHRQMHRNEARNAYTETTDFGINFGWFCLLCTTLLKNPSIHDWQSAMYWLTDSSVYRFSDSIIYRLCDWQTLQVTDFIIYGLTDPSI